MSRADRLQGILHILRDGRVHKAEDLATRLGVSPRTIYRDMDTLAASGLPVKGERGTGYVTTAPVTLPPINLTMAELEALHLGIAVVSEAADDELQAAGRSLSAKIDAALPEDTAPPAQGWGFASYPFASAAAGFHHLPPIRAAIRARQKLKIDHRSADGGRASERVRPLALDYWGRIWTVTAWSETSADFLVLRVDEIEAVSVLPELFVDEPGRTLAEYQARAGNRNG